MFVKEITQKQVALPVTLQGGRLGRECIVEVMLNNTIILEFKSMEALLPAIYKNHTNCSKLSTDFKPNFNI